MKYGDQLTPPRDGDGRVDYNLGWKLWSDMARYYPSAVHRRRVITRWARNAQPATVLDVGCGTGVLLEHLHGKLPAARLTGSDYAAETMSANAIAMPWCGFHALDIAQARLPDSFDLVICSEVLEHVGDDEGAIAHLAAMTRGHLIITVPAGPMYPLERGFGHLRHYTLPSLTQRVERHDLRVLEARAWGFPWMSAFKRASNLRPTATAQAFGAGSWGAPQRAVAALLTALFYLNWSGSGPQLFMLAGRHG